MPRTCGSPGRLKANRPSLPSRWGSKCSPTPHRVRSVSSPWAAAHSTGFVQEALTMQVRNLMRSPVVTVDLDQSLQHAAQVMQEHGIGSVVVEQGGQVVGILTERDVMHAAARLGDVDRPGSPST